MKLRCRSTLLVCVVLAVSLSLTSIFASSKLKTVIAIAAEEPQAKSAHHVVQGNIKQLRDSALITNVEHVTSPRVVHANPQETFAGPPAAAKEPEQQEQSEPVPNVSPKERTTKQNGNVITDTKVELHAKSAVVANVKQERNSESTAAAKPKASPTIVANATTLADFKAQSSQLPKKGHPLCSRLQIRNGAWNPITLQAPPYEVPSTRQCFPDNIKSYLEKSEWKTHEWLSHDSSCALTRWSTEDFCRVFDNKTIAILGDSLSWEQYTALVYVTGGSVRNSEQWRSRDENVNIVRHACPNDAVRLLFRRDAGHFPLPDFLTENPDVFIMNRGAHFFPDKDTMREMVKTQEVIKAWLAKTTKVEDQPLVIWRTTAPGHINCLEYTEPFPGTLQEMEARVGNRSLYTAKQWSHNWRFFNRQNKMFLRLWQEDPATADAVKIMDGYEINIMRPDHHRAQAGTDRNGNGDCLHSCLPGKVDVYNQLMLHYMKLHAHQQHHHSYVTSTSHR